MSAAAHHAKYCDLVKKAQQLNSEKQVDGFLGGEDQAEFDSIMADAVKNKERADQLVELEKAASSLNDFESIAAPAAKKEAKKASPRVALRQGWNADGSPRYIERDSASPLASQEYREAYLEYLKTGNRHAALQTDNATQAGYLVADQVLAAGILKGVDDLLFIRQRANVRTVSNSKSLGIRKRTARLSSFAWGEEIATPTADTALAYGKKVLTPHYASGSILVSNDLLMNADVDAAAEVQGEISYDGAILMEDAYLTGSGAQQPLGVFTASSDGVSTSQDVVTGSTTNFTLDGLINGVYSMKAQHRSAARWLLHRDGINKVARLVDGDSQPIFRVGAGRMQDSGRPEDVLLGYPVDESERAPNTFTNGNYVAVLANWRYYEIADGLDMSFSRLNELNARTNQTEFLARLKTDGMPVLEEAFIRMKCGT